jgi:hypothetical protein
MVFISLDHLLVMLSFFVGSWFLPFAFPLSFLLSVFLYICLEKKENITKKIWTILLSFSVIVVSLVVSAFYFDLSWDGQWYLQSAIYHLRSGWNPVFEPIRTFEENNDSSIIHFPKGYWYYAASVFSTLGNFESGKSLNFILIFVSIVIINSTLQNFGLSKGKSLIIALLVVLNPVVWSETTTYLVDGSLILYISIYILMVFAWLREPNYKNMLIGALAITGMINLKFTGLVFFCVLAFLAAIGVLIYKRQYLVKFLGAHAVVLLVSVLIFGYNPYVSNFIKRGHPFYPIMGTAKYPSVYEQTGRDDNEIYETPLNMQGKPLMIRMFYANFGRPDNAPYYKERNAELIWPFSSKPADWKAYYFHETRVSGFGPYFGGILILSFILLLFIIIKDKKSRWAICLTLLAIFGSLFLSKHFWWPRFGPQMWLIPLIPVCFYFFRPVSKCLNYYAWMITVIFLINGSIVLYMHMDWETRSSITLRKQLTELQKNNKPIEIFYGWFKKSMEEKLDRWQIEYEAVSPRVMMEGAHMNLTSVVEGYPNMVMYREKVENK